MSVVLHDGRRLWAALHLSLLLHHLIRLLSIPMLRMMMMMMVMTFVLHHLSHYNSNTEPRALFLLSFLEHLTIDFSSHFILSIIDVHLDSASRDKLIFPFTITRILRHFSVPFPSSNHFSIMCAIDYATVKRSEAQFRSRQMDSAAPSSRFAPSWSTPSASAPSSSSDVS